METWNQTWGTYLLSAPSVSDSPEHIPFSPRVHWSLGSWPRFDIQIQPEWAKGRKWLELKLHFRMSQKWQDVNKSRDHRAGARTTGQELGPQREGGEQGVDPGWRIGAINKFIAISPHGCSYSCPSHVQHLLRPILRHKFFSGMALGSKFWHKSCHFSEQKLLVTPQCI